MQRTNFSTTVCDNKETFSKTKQTRNKSMTLWSWCDQTSLTEVKKNRTSRAGIRIRVRQEFLRRWNSDLVLMLKAAQLCLSGSTTTGWSFLSSGEAERKLRVSASNLHTTLHGSTNSLIHHPLQISTYRLQLQLHITARHALLQL